MLFLELHHRLEEVHIALYQGIEAVQLVQGQLGLEAVIADQASGHSPVLLLDVGVVVLLVGSGPSEGDVLLLAIGKEVVVDELAAVVRIRAQQGEGEGLADLVDGAHHPLLALAQEGASGYPPGGDVNGAEGVEILTFSSVAAVGH